MNFYMLLTKMWLLS